MFVQVSATEEDREPPSETPCQTTPDGLDQTVAKHLGTMAFKLALSKEEAEVTFAGCLSFF